jgi:ferrous iron transport protein B
MWDVAQDKKITIDAKKLQEILGVPVVPTIAVSGRGIKDIVIQITNAKPVDFNTIISNVGGKNT